MLTCILVSILSATLIVIIGKYLTKKNHKPSNEFTNASCHSGEDCEYAGLWTFLKLMTLALLDSRKDPSYHETAYMKLYEHFKRTFNNISILKYTFFGASYVFANSAKSIREFLCNENCGNRVPDKYLGHLTGVESTGILFAQNNATYKELRKYTIRTLGKLGFGKNEGMSVILDVTLNDFLQRLETIRKDEGNKVQVEHLFTLSVINIVWAMVGGNMFKHNDERLHKLQNYVNKACSESALSFLWGSTFPKFVLNIMQWLGVKCQSLAEMHRHGSQIFLEYIDEIDEFRKHSKGHTEEIEEDFVNHFLSQIEKHKDDDKLNKIYCKNQLASILVDFFSAGIDTTEKFMESFIMYMVMYPDVQARMFMEIDEVVGDTSPSYSAHSKCMPYTQAVISEMHRTVNIVQVQVRSVVRDCKIGNNTFKKNAMIAMMHTSMNLDETYWDDAKIFRPERFLDGDNNILTEKVNLMMPFGAGVRMCPGENVAKAATFTLMVGMLQRYAFRKSIENEFVGLQKSMALTGGPEPFHVSMFLR